MEITKVREYISEQAEKKSLKPNKNRLLKDAVSFIAGFLLTNPYTLYGQLAPFAVSSVCVLPEREMLASALGTVLGSIIFASGVNAVKYIAAAILCASVRLLGTRYFEKEFSRAGNYSVGGASIFIVGSAVMLATGFDGEEFLAVLCETALCVAGAFVISEFIKLLKSKPTSLTVRDTVILLFVFGIPIMPFIKYSVFGFSPVACIFAFTVLVGGKLKGRSGGSAAGICVAVMLGLSGCLGCVCAGYAMAGLCCGEASRKNKFICVLWYILPVCIAAVIDGSLEAFMAVPEGLVACIAMLLIPDRLWSKFSEKLSTPTSVHISDKNSSKISEKLENVSEAVEQISVCIDSVQKSLRPVPQIQLNESIRACLKRVCGECDFKESCSDEVKRFSDSAVEHIADALKGGARPDSSIFPNGFDSQCFCFEKMLSETETAYLNFNAQLGAQGKVEQLQGLMSDQFRSTAEILRGIASELEDGAYANAETARLCASEAAAFGLEVLSAESELDRFGRITVSIEIAPPRENFNVTALTEALSAAVGASLELPELEEEEKSCTLKFESKIMLTADVGAYSRSADDLQVCGDYFRSFRDTEGRHITVLSDGMGTGTRAAVDSAMAAEIFSKLIRAGLSFDCALPIANSALLVKSDDESLATLDVSCIDLHTGKAEFFKAGAAATYLRRSGSVAALERASLPMGILRGVTFSKATAKLEKGDIILMLSDGIPNDGRVQQELKLWQGHDPRELAKFVVNSACDRRLGKQRDDTTAIAIFIK